MKNKDIKSIRRENKFNRYKTDNSARIAFYGFLLFVFIIWCFKFGQSTLTWFITSLPVNQPVVVNLSPLEQAVSHIELKTTWNVVSINSDSNLYVNIDLTNNNDKAIQNFELLCIPDYGTPTINELKVSIFNAVPSHSNIRLKDYNFGHLTDQVKDVKCKINDLTLS